MQVPDIMREYSRTHRPPYVMRVAREWRVVVPIRGKLAPRTCEQRFATKLAAEEWLQSSDGTEVIETLRTRGKGVVARNDHRPAMT